MVDLPDEICLDIKSSTLEPKIGYLRSEAKLVKMERSLLRELTAAIKVSILNQTRSQEQKKHRFYDWLRAP